MFKKIFLLCVVGVGFVPFVTYGAVVHCADTYVFPETEIVKENIYICSKDNLSLLGAVDGDVIGGTFHTFLINGTTTKDILGFGQDVIINGIVGDDMRIVGATVTLNGSVKGDAVIAGSRIVLHASSTINKDLIIAGGDVEILGEVTGRSRIYATDVFIDGVLGSDVVINARSIILGQHAVVNGSLKYTAPKEVEVTSGAQILGAVEFTEADSNPATNKNFSAVSVAVLFVLLFVSGLFAKIFFGNLAVSLIEETTNIPAWKFTLGFLLFVFIPIIALVSIMTLVGSLIGIAVGFLYVVGLIVSVILSPIIVGSLLYKWIAKTPEYNVDIKTVLVGALSITVISLIPIVGIVFGGVIVLLLFGTITYMAFEALREVR
ncbi:MAG: hypothetical protein WC757_02340 [Candidatus Paceibacterota bacterium]|jgi:cytoskeletal protein CcmA (bactofilin family)